MYYDVSTCHVYLQILRASTSPEKFIELRYRNRLRQANGTTGSLSARPKREFEASLGMEVGYCRWLTISSCWVITIQLHQQWISQQSRDSHYKNQSPGTFENLLLSFVWSDLVGVGLLFWSARLWAVVVSSHLSNVWRDCRQSSCIVWTVVVYRNRSPLTLTRKNKENWPRAHVHKALRVLFHEDADAARQKCPNFWNTQRNLLQRSADLIVQPCSLIQWSNVFSEDTATADLLGAAYLGVEKHSVHMCRAWCSAMLRVMQLKANISCHWNSWQLSNDTEGI